MTNEQIRSNIEALRADAARCLTSPDSQKQETAGRFLRMAEILKVLLLARGERVVVVSTTGQRWGRA